MWNVTEEGLTEPTSTERWKLGKKFDNSFYLFFDSGPAFPGSSGRMLGLIYI